VSSVIRSTQRSQVSGDVPSSAAPTSLETKAGVRAGKERTDLRVVIEVQFSGLFF
jgi:hypothetical protein